MTDAAHPPVIRVSAAVILDEHDRVLVVRKRGTTAFMQPGGKIDPGETALDALRRELSEEIGVTVDASDAVALGHFTAAAANEPDHVVAAELFLVTVRTEPRAAAEIAEIAWIDVHAPVDIELAPLTEQAVRELLRR